MPMTFDQATVDGTGAFLVHELERLDQTLNLPLVNFTWSRDIQLREDVSIADEISSFTNTTFAAAGTPNANGKNWLSKAATAMAGLNVDIAKTGFPLTLWGMELGWTVPELQAAAQVGRADRHAEVRRHAAEVEHGHGRAGLYRRFRSER